MTNSVFLSFVIIGFLLIFVIMFVGWLIIRRKLSTPCKTPSCFIFPSDNPMGNNREYVKVEIPESVNRFVDNVLAIQNNSHGTWYGNEQWGNACITFMDNQGNEKGAVGYSRNETYQPSGYIKNTLYCEIGAPFTNNTDETDFRVIVTQSDKALHFAGTTFYPIEVVTATGATTLRARGTGKVNVEGGLLPDALYLKSNNGTTYKITVDDNGNLSAVAQ